MKQLIKVYIHSKKRNEIVYLLDMCLMILRCNYSLIENLDLLNEEDYLITNVPTTRHQRQIIIDEQYAIKLFNKASLINEIEINRYDKHTRLPGAVLSGDVERAELSEFVYFLQSKLEECVEISNKPTVILSHDVDRISNKEFFTVCGRFVSFIKSFFLFNINKIIVSFKSLMNSLVGKNTYWNFEEIMNLESKYGFKSTFFFLLGRKGIEGARYNLEEVEHIVKKLHRMGWEVGLHINYFGYDDTNTIKFHKRALEKIISDSVYGARFHWLRFDPKSSFNVLEECGFKYDTTLGFFDRLGFRVGLAHPYFPYDFKLKKRSHIMEIPLVVMDIALFEYMKLSSDEAWLRIRNILEKFKNKSAVITIVWHSNVFEDPIFKGWKEVYEKILEYLSTNGFNVMLGKDMYKFYSEQH